MKEANFIEPSISPFAAIIVCVQKGDGSLCVIIDVSSCEDTAFTTPTGLYQ